MLFETISTTLTKALANSLSQTTYTALSVMAASPKGTDGVWAAGHDGDRAPNRVHLLPYCQGPAGSAFTMRLYGWQLLGNPDGSPSTLVWIPLLLCELLCVAGEIPGLQGRLVADTERLCDAIALTRGNLGTGGVLNSTGPGTGLVAHATCALYGCRYFQFDFASGEESQPLMNCLWARA